MLNIKSNKPLLTSLARCGLSVFTTLLVTLSASGLSSNAQAATSSCDSGNGTTLRHWMLNNAYACEAGKGSPERSADIEAVGAPFNFDSWELAEQITSAGDNSKWLNIEFVVGDWHAGSVFVTWELAPGYWDSHGTAVFSVSVGDGSNDNSDDSLKDFATFIISPGQSSGTLVFAQVTKDGAQDVKPIVGGLAEIRLWTPIAAPQS